MLWGFVSIPKRLSHTMPFCNWKCRGAVVLV